MSLRTGLLLCLAAIALASLGVYYGLSRHGGVGLPGGKAAIEQTLAPYAKAGSIMVSPPRAAYLDDGEGVILTLRSVQFALADVDATVDLQRIRARIDAARLAQGAIRFHDISVGQVALTYDVSAAAQTDMDDAPPSFKSAMEDIAGAYDMAFSDIQLHKLAELDFKQLLVRLVEGDALLAQGEGRLALRPAGDTVQLNADLAWDMRGKLEGSAASQVFGIAGPDRPLDLVLTIEGPALAVKGSFEASDVSAKAELVAGSQERDALRLTLSAGAVTVRDPDVYEDAAQLKSLALTSDYQVGSDALSASISSLKLDETEFTATVALKDVSSPDTSIKGQAQFTDLPVATLHRFWPRGLGEGGRVWVRENIEEGLLISPQLSVDAALSDLINDEGPVNALELRFGLKDALAHYRRPMPPIQDGVAEARMTLDAIRIEIGGGTVGGVDVAGSSVFITAFRQSTQVAEIALRVNGDAGRLATVLDSEPLEYLSTYGVDPEALVGPIAGRALLTMPLLKDLLMDDVRLSARIDANQLRFQNLMEDSDALLQRVVMEINQDALNLRSDFAMDGLDGAIRWDEDFSGEVTSPTAVSLSGKVAPEALPRWLPGVANMLFGTVFYDAKIVGRGAHIDDATLTADLTAAAISIPELGYEKPVGEAAEFYAAAQTQGDAIRFEALTLNGPDLLFIGDGDYNDTAQTASLTWQTVEVGESKGNIALSREDDNWLIAGNLGTLDVRPIIDMFWAGALTPPAGEKANAETDTVINLSIDAASILLDNDLKAGQTRFLGSFQGDHIRQLNVYGQGPAEAPFTLTIEPIDSGRRLVLAAEQAGPLASGLGMIRTAEGGRLSVQATSFERGDELGLTGIAEMSDIRLTEAPILARLAGLGSLSGISDLARDRGLNFTDMEIPFELKNGIVRVTNASAYGPALGITADGEFLESLEKADIRGVIVPSYTINSALGRVPVLGNLLVGGENAGLFGINYKVSGSLEDPDLDVNAASVLTPGFLRGIFGRQRGRLDEVASEPLTSSSSEAGGL